MASTLQRLDPERQRRRLRVLAELADTKAGPGPARPRRGHTDRLRDMIAARRRLAS